MNCEQWQERIALYAGGDAMPAGAADVERHLELCPGCHAFEAEMREALVLLRGAHAELPDAAHFTAVRSRVLAELERKRYPWGRLAWISGVAAMLMVAVWPRTPAVPVPPRMAAVIPGASLAVTRTAAVPPKPKRQVAAKREKHEPFTVRMQTSDPNIVIYWIAD
jgi:anti-sigma factor RsiW